MKARAIYSALLCLALLAGLILPYLGRPMVAAAQNESLSARYVLFLGGVNSSSSSEGGPIGGDFSVIQATLQQQGFSKFVYFSYGAAAFPENSYCLGWGYPLHTPAQPCKGVGASEFRGDLNELWLNPLYSEDDTKDHTIEEQAKALDWLIGQIVRVDSSAQIDLVGFSLGGIVASYWVAEYGDSPHRTNVRSLVLLNSPVGGFPLFNVIGDCPFELSCWVLRGVLAFIFGENILRQLQLDLRDESIVGTLRKASRTAPLIPITSIQSTEDYLVNSRSLQFLYPGVSPIEEIPCLGEKLAGLVGEGTQSWPATPPVWEYLGGRQETSVVCLPDVPNVLLGNHNAALRGYNGDNTPAERAAQLVLEAIQSPGATEPQQPAPPGPQGQSAILTLPTADGADGCKALTMAQDDDGSSPTVALPFSLNFAGASYSALHVNTNGNVTFDAPLSLYVPFDLQQADRAIIAPFFADVDTRRQDAGLVTYSGNGATLNGRPAFCANWTGVGYFDRRADKRNSFQLLLIDRSDIRPGDFDIMFNYGQVEWDTANPTTQFPDVVPARAGYSNGATFAFELPGSAVAGSFLDSNAATGLIRHSLGSSVPGQYIFEVRGGSVAPPVDPTSTPAPDPAPTPAPSSGWVLT